MSQGEVSLIGAGLLGGAIAERLQECGWNLRIYDPDASARAKLAGLAADWAQSEAEAARGAAILVFCLPTSDVTLGIAGGAFAGMRAGGLVIDCTTGDPEQMEELGRTAAAAGLRYVDATVGGPSTQARAGQAVIMAGGDAADVEEARTVLGCISHQVLHAGAVGAGARLKLVFNLALGLHRAVLAEALHFAEAMEIPGEIALAALKEGAAYSAVMDLKGQRMLHRDYAPQARLAQHHKDVRLMLHMARDLGIELPLSALHDTLLSEAEAMGLGAQDNSAVREVYRTATARRARDMEE